MRHRNYGSKLGRQPAHRRATLRNLVTNVIEKERITTTVTRAKAAKPLVEQMITLGKRDTLHARRQAASEKSAKPEPAEEEKKEEKAGA
ncbi:MAG: hypothetical protein LAO19_09570 [Acidobacteriia bacterium]|nr:hypothetical protein [Terriglobia bacterium]